MSEHKSIIFGLHAVQSVLLHQPQRILHLMVLTDRRDQKINQLVALAKKNNVNFEYVARDKLDKASDTANHQGIVALCKAPPKLTEHDLAQLLNEIQEPPFILILDGVQDPQNLGACLRSADAAGVHIIIAPKDKSVGITPIVSKVASGAAETVRFVQATNLVRALEILKKQGIWIYGAAGEAAQLIYQMDLRGPVALVLGAEGTGLRRLTREHCDALVRIPMYGTVESLNVSVATGIMLFEAVRQRHT